ncbi:MAG: hypothetical protein PUG68_09725 [Lachnospiraceae bacterium]|nr:hypothetical protein [Lachnospiraceae bacterium]MDD7328053.1 hypothetical protein [Lachnospiraceae bacterium]MDY2760208.1 hypothetical protein [Lachnospiraceae bacterium]
MNPGSIFKIKGILDKFNQNHPKVVSYFSAVFGNGMPEGSIIELTVTKPGEEPVTTNMKVTADDVELVQTLKELK